MATLSTKIKLRSDIKTNREKSTIVLLKGEAFVEFSTITNSDDTTTTQQKIYIGDGSTQLKDLKPATMTPEEIKELIKEAQINFEAKAAGGTGDEDPAYAELSISNGAGSEKTVSLKGEGSLTVAVDEDADEIVISDASLLQRVTTAETNIGDMQFDEKFKSDTKNLTQAANELKNEIADVKKDYVVTMTPTANPTDWAKEYTFYQGTAPTKEGEEDNRVEIGKIQIPKDMVVSEGKVEKLDQDKVNELIQSGDLDEDSKAGYYILLTISNAEKTTLYIPAESLIDDYTGKTTDEMKVTVDTDNNEISAEVVKLKTSKLIDDPNEILILNGGSATA